MSKGRETRSREVKLQCSALKEYFKSIVKKVQGGVKGTGRMGINDTEKLREGTKCLRKKPNRSRAPECYTLVAYIALVTVFCYCNFVQY